MLVSASLDMYQITAYTKCTQGKSAFAGLNAIIPHDSRYIPQSTTAADMAEYHVQNLILFKTALVYVSKSEAKICLF